MRKKISDKKKEAMLKAYDKIILPYERKFKDKVNKLLLDQSKRLATSLRKYMRDNKADEINEEEATKKAEKIVKNFYDFDSDIQILMKELLPLYINIAKLGNEFFNDIHIANNTDKILFAVIRDDYLTWLDEYGGNQIRRINDTTKDVVRKVIKDGLIKGQSYNIIADNLVKEIEEFTKVRALNIAQTETHNSFMRGNFMTANESGFTKKTWLTSRDEAVRTEHAKIDGMTIGINEDFLLGLGYPGDERAEARLTIRCRCILTYS